MTARSWLFGFTVLFASLAIVAGGLYWAKQTSPNADAVAEEGNAYRYQFPIGIDQGDSPERQIEFYEARLRRDPTGPNDPAALAFLYLNRAKALGDALDFDQAERMARLSIKNRSRGNTTALAALADLAQTRHEFPKAIELAQRILREDSHHNQALSILTTSYLALGDLVAASSSADALVDALPGPSAFATRGLILALQGRDAEATEDFEAAIRSEDVGERRASARARTLYGRFQLLRGHLKKAQVLLKEAVRISPDDQDAIGWLARLEESRSNWLEAAHLYRKAFELSNQPVFLLGEARNRIRQGDVAEGFKLRTQAEHLMRATLNSRENGHRNDLIRLLLERDRAGDAHEALLLAQEEARVRTGTETLFLLAIARLKNGYLDAARSAMRSLLRKGVRDAEIYLGAAAIEDAAGNERLAATYRQMASEIRPGFEPDLPVLKGNP